MPGPNMSRVVAAIGKPHPAQITAERLASGVAPHVFLEDYVLGKPRVAHIAAVRSFAGVGHHVPPEVAALGEPHRAHLTGKRALDAVSPQVRREAAALRELHLADVAAEQFLFGVHPHVPRQTVHLGERLAALAARERPRAGVDADVRHEVAGLRERLRADITFERFLVARVLVHVYSEVVAPVESLAAYRTFRVAVLVPCQPAGLAESSMTDFALVAFLGAGIVSPAGTVKCLAGRVWCLKLVHCTPVISADIIIVAQ